ncbi:30S ribosomal protein S18 [Candidatus Beckwithbacteria bacterium RIFCSPLOWO2_02_FULL_47_23]|uniref:Small ribosomal subunit protein bS18 n=2 Tax=Candidatus Beckwithiibacteriota TaxID=1752726 RepID=A0A1F5DYF7_9BACT|nr:MAG: 30S ribosomal protein S18 [Candidatus Beckwithbacteria bacterium RIFCSPHIGHO2_12_FULL_47_17]OGD60192.1 MAG: 30S ribosomal protein S18 [Candidatus Beckwithbacteria bacterium RIFCSPLOWO2_02_FULL_47_23]
MRLKCWFCQNEKLPDYKDFDVLNKFLSDRGKILGRDKTGICARHQRRLAREIKHARHLALLPFVS